MAVGSRYRTDRVGRRTSRRERRLRALLDHSPDLIVRFDRRLRHVYVNRAAELAAGRPREEMLGRTNLELGMPVALVERWEEALREVLASGEVGVMEFDYPAAEGMRTFESRLAPEIDALRRVTGVLAVTRDLTERVRAERALRDREEQYRALAEGSPDAIGRYDGDLRLVYANVALERAIGVPRGQLLGRRSGELGAPPEVGALWERAERAVFETGAQQSVEWALPTPEGRRWFTSRLAPEYTPSGEVEHVVFTAREITELKSAQESLSTRLAQQEAMAVLADFALRIDEPGRLLEHTVEMVATVLAVPLVKVLEREADDVFRVRAGVGWRDGTVGDARMTGDSQATYTLASSSPVLLTDSVDEDRFPLAPLLAEHGVRCGMSAPIRTFRRTYGVIGVHAVEPRVFTDDDLLFVEAVAGILGSALGRVEAESDLRERALRDPLTGLANRTLLLDRTKSALARLARSGETVAVLFLDLDNFKPINDSLGHDTGDAILRQVADRLQAAVRPADTVARFGGDEFVVLSDDLPDEREAGTIAARVLATMSEPYELGDRLLQMSASLGMVTATSPVEAEDLLRAADIAMYRAKEGGGGRIETFDDVFRKRADRLMETQLDLRDAIERDEFRLHFQPQVRVDDWRITGAEALLRWEHPTRGLLAPAEFLTAAERSGLLAPVGAWVRAEAIRQVAAWDRRGVRLAQMSINLFSCDLADSDLVADLAELAATNGVERGRVCVEVTEEALRHDLDAARETLGALHRIGVTIALDDFGAGHSSLRHLQDLPLDVVKIDRTLVARLVPGPAHSSLVEGALAMLRTMGLAAVAEGVETPPQLHALEQLGCPTVAGHLFSRPLPPKEAEALFAGGVMHPSAAAADRF